MTKKPDTAILRRLREQQGRRAENAAALWLRLKGYRILDRRARTPACEIDLVAAKKNMVVFVEVKSAPDARESPRDRNATSCASAWSRPPISGSRATATCRTTSGASISSCSPPAASPRHMRDAWTGAAQ